MTPRQSAAKAAAARSLYCAERRALEHVAQEIAARHNYDPARMERHARVIEALDPGCAEAVREYRLPGKRRAA